MHIKKTTLVTPRPKMRYKDKNYVQMRNPVSNQPLNENDSVTLKDLEELDLLIVETRPHEHYSYEKKQLFRKQRFYYMEV